MNGTEARANLDCIAHVKKTQNKKKSILYPVSVSFPFSYYCRRLQHFSFFPAEKLNQVTKEFIKKRVKSFLLAYPVDSTKKPKEG